MKRMPLARHRRIARSAVLATVAGGAVLLGGVFGAGSASASTTGVPPALIQRNVNSVLPEADVSGVLYGRDIHGAVRTWNGSSWNTSGVPGDVIPTSYNGNLYSTNYLPAGAGTTELQELQGATYVTVATFPGQIGQVVASGSELFMSDSEPDGTYSLLSYDGRTVTPVASQLGDLEGLIDNGGTLYYDAIGADGNDDIYNVSGGTSALVYANQYYDQATTLNGALYFFNNLGGTTSIDWTGTLEELSGSTLTTLNTGSVLTNPESSSYYPTVVTYHGTVYLNVPQDFGGELYAVQGNALKDIGSVPGADDSLVVHGDSLFGGWYDGQMQTVSAGSWLYNDLAVAGTPTPAATPTISGATTVGKTLTANPGPWYPTAELTYRWTRNGTTIPKATSSTYTTASADASAALRVIITGTAPGYSAVSRTSPPTNIAAGTITYKTLTAAGTPTVGKTLTATFGGLTPPTASVKYQWRLNGAAVARATTKTFAVTAADANRSISVSVTVSAPGFTTITAKSPGRTIGRALTRTPTPAVTGNATVGDTLTAKAGSWAPNPVALHYQWQLAGKAIPGATRATYKLISADAGKSIRVMVTGTKTGYTPVQTASAGRTVKK